MSKFDNIILKQKNTLQTENITGDSVISKAVEDLENAIKNSGTLSANRNAKELASKLFEIPDKSNPLSEPLKKAFDKIMKDPNSSNLTDEEKNLIMSVINPKTETNPTEPEEGTKTTQQSTPQQPSQQPNAKQYNPLNQ